MNQLVGIMFLVLLMTILVTVKANGQTQEEIVIAIETQAIKHGVEPEIAVAIAKVESSLNPKAIGGLGEIGLFQLRPEFHNVVRGNPKHNIKLAIKYLAQIRSKWEPVYGDAWFIKFNLGPNYRRLKHPTLFPYYKKVQREMSRSVAAN